MERDRRLDDGSGVGVSATRGIVTDGESRAALAAVRSLGAAGHELHVVASDPGNLAGASRWAASEHLLPDPAAEPARWAACLEEKARELDVDWVLPVTEVAIGTAFAEGLDARLDLVCPSRDAYEAAIDKHLLLEQGARAGLAAPRGRLVERPDQLEALPDDFAYPVVLKPRRSRILRDGRWVTCDVQIVRDADAFAAAVRSPAMSGGALLQDLVPGFGEAVFVGAHEGEVLAAFAHRRLREKPPSGGVSVLRESIAPDPVLLEGSRRLVEELRYTGVAMVEFRRSPDGTAYLMEINPRLWGSVQLAIDAGIDFPAIQLALHRGEPVASASATLGVRCRWLLGDLDHMLICLRRAHERRATGRGRGRVVGDFVRGFFDGSRNEVCRRGDLRPFTRELRRWHRS